FLDKLTGGRELVSIMAGGNVGIGTNQPKALLSLGGAAADTKLALQEGLSGVYGLGFATNQFSLHLGGNIDDQFSFLDSPGGNELVRFGVLGGSGRSFAEFTGDATIGGDLGVSGDAIVQNILTVGALEV